ncbi:cation:proton antiporter [Streptomyces sp. NPDC001514]
MEGADIAVLVLLAVGVAMLLLSAVSLVVLPGPYARLHALAPASVLGGPLIALAAAVDLGPGRGAVKALLIGALIAVGGTMTTMAIGRATAAQEGRAREGTPR